MSFVISLTGWQSRATICARRKPDALRSIFDETGARPGNHDLRTLRMGRGISGAIGGRVGRARLSLSYRRDHARAPPGLPHHRRALRRAGSRVARNGGVGRQHADAGLRRRALRGGTTARRLALLHHHSRHARSREVVQALGRPASAVSEVQLRRHGRRALPAPHRAPQSEARARGDRQFHGRHGNLDLRNQVSVLYGHRRADGVPARPKCRAATG